MFSKHHIDNIVKFLTNLWYSIHFRTILVMLSVFSIILICAAFPSAGGFFMALGFLVVIYWMVYTLIKMMSE